MTEKTSERAIPIETLKWWRELVDLNPSDLAPRIEAAIAGVATPLRNEAAHENIFLAYKIREALGFGKLHPLSRLDDDVRAMRTALVACAPLAHASIADAGDVLGYIGGADTSSKEPITVTITTTLGELREARRALWVANVEPPRARFEPKSEDEAAELMDNGRNTGGGKMRR